MFPINIDEIITTIILFLPKLAVAVVVLAVFLILARLLRGSVLRFGKTRHLSPDIISILDQISEVGLIIFGIVSALASLGIDVGAMIAGLGLVGFALGFALKDLLSNFLSGLLILIYNPFVRGDHIEVLGNAGIVLEVNLRYTVLEDSERRILIPNANLFSNPVIVRRGGTVKTVKTIIGG